jgi:beta-lactamase regulating signal transducer with metallopeptidase domain
MMASHELVNAVAQVSAERLLDSLLIGMALAVFAWTLLRLLPRQNSATRFALWFAALIATAVLPFINSAPASSTLMQTVAPTARPLVSVPASWALYLFVFWAVIAAVSVARFIFGFVELRRLRRHCLSIEIADPAWRDIAARICPARQVEILSSDRIHVPTAIGFFKPAVIIPTSLQCELTPAELTQVLLHEFAHLRRWDDWTNLLQKFINAVLFFHPAVWWMEERIALEREMACDDAVLAETASPHAYAECLATLAEKSFLRRSAALAQAAVNRIRQTSLRVAQILDPKRSTSRPVGKSALALLGAFACACAAITWNAPQLVGFETFPPPMIAGNAVASVRTPQPVLTASATALRAEAQPRLVAKRRSPQPRAIMAKATAVPETHSPARRRGSVLPVVEQQHHAPQVIQAKAAHQPLFQAGVVVIFIDDPVFGPTPVFWHFAVWQITPPQHAEQGVPQKNI